VNSYQDFTLGLLPPQKENLKDQPLSVFPTLAALSGSQDQASLFVGGLLNIWAHAYACSVTGDE
jgi:hypothetical protein